MIKMLTKTDHLYACPYCKNNLFKKNDSLLCVINPAHNFIKEEGIYNFVIDIGDATDAKKWADNLRNIYKMRSQIKKISTNKKTNTNSESITVYNFISQFIKSPQTRLLELGCGNGVMSKHLKQIEYIGMDPLLPEQITFPYIRGIAEALPLNKNTIDICLCKDSLSYYRDLDQVFKEVERTLNKNGVFIITEYVGKYYYKPIILKIRRLIRRTINKIRGRIDWEDTCFQFRFNKEIHTAIQKSCFKIINEYYKPKEQRWFIVLRK